MLVLTEMVHGREEADAIGWTSCGHATLIECKATRDDFLSDKTKSFRRRPETGMAVLRYYLTNEGIISTSELPSNWGLLVLKNDKFQTRAKPQPQKADTQTEKTLILSAIRRIGQTAPKGISVKYYTYQTRRKATLGVSWHEEDK